MASLSHLGQIVLLTVPFVLLILPWVKYHEATLQTERETRKSFILLLYLQFPREKTALHAGPLSVSTGVSHKAEEGSRTVGKHLYCGFHGKERARQSKQA